MQKTILFIVALCTMVACRHNDVAQDEETTEAKTPVTVAGIGNEAMAEYVELNATSTFLQKWIVRANTTGYLKTANVAINKVVQNGQLLYSIKTKEAQSIGNSISILDSSFRFSGINNIKANGAGFISEINHQTGDYVQDGEQLAVITDTKSFVFLLDMPYELRSYIINKKNLEMILPDGEKLTAVITGFQPVMNAASQTQSIVLKVSSPHALPENLVARVRVAKSFSRSGNSLPKAAVLTNETQTEFWIMKLLNDSVAAKTIVKKGIETQDRIEILSPVLTPEDKIIVTGNYGLNDTANIEIIKE